MKKFTVTILVLVLCIIVGFSAAQFIAGRQSIPKIAKTFIHPTPTPRPTISTPMTLTIPKLGITSHIEAVGLDKNLRMDVPKGVGDTGWYSLGPKPAEAGNAVIDGHFDTPTGAPSVFYYIGNLKTGDTIQVTDTNKKSYTFIVTKVTHYPDNGFPIVQVFGPSTQPHLNLITCSGTWDKVAHNYSERTVVFSTLSQ